MNGGPPVNQSLRDKVTALELEFTSQSVPLMTTTTYTSPASKKSIWDNLPQSITTTTVLIPVISTVTLYK